MGRVVEWLGQMVAWMEGGRENGKWTVEYLVSRMDGWLDAWMHELIGRNMDTCLDGWMHR